MIFNVFKKSLVWIKKTKAEIGPILGETHKKLFQGLEYEK